MQGNSSEVDWQVTGKYDTPRHRFCRVAAVHVAHYDDSGVDLHVQVAMFASSIFFILSVFFLGMFWVFCSGLPL